MTYDQRREDSQALLARSLKSVYDRLGDKMIVGAGTVMTADQVRAAYDVGASYIVAPNTDPAVIETTKKLGMLSSPGALTPTEVVTAYQLGGDIVKLFPAGDLGFGYIKNLRGPLNYIPLMATGGVNPNNISDFFAAGIQVVGTCPTVIPADDVANDHYDHITQLGPSPRGGGKKSPFLTYLRTVRASITTGHNRPGLKRSDDSKSYES